MRFALVTADSSHKRQFVINGEEGDATSFMNWIDVWKGVHLSFEALQKEDISYLKDFEVVMFSGHPRYLADIEKLAAYLKNSDTITIFYPEGSTQLYDNSIAGFQIQTYRTWNACDILSPAEEDKTAYYESFISSDTIVRFIHVPLRWEMEQGYFFVHRQQKVQDLIAVYGDNNPNHPMIALACANRLRMKVVGVDLRDHDIQSVFPFLNLQQTVKMAQYPFLRLLGKTFLHFYPTEWIGTAREQIACACVGTPCIGNPQSHTQRRLWPELAPRDIYDVDDMMEIAKGLIDDPIFYDHIVEKAWKALSFYSLENTKARFKRAVHDAEIVKKKKKEITCTPI